MTTENGEKSAPLALGETLYIATNDGAELPFEVVGILADEENDESYVVLLHEPEDEAAEGEFIVTDLYGNMLDDDTLAQDILDDFLLFAEESGESGEAEGKD
jgi:hypothetical protein